MKGGMTVTVLIIIAVLFVGVRILSALASKSHLPPGEEEEEFEDEMEDLDRHNK